MNDEHLQFLCVNSDVVGSWYEMDVAISEAGEPKQVVGVTTRGDGGGSGACVISYDQFLYLIND